MEHKINVSTRSNSFHKQSLTFFIARKNENITSRKIEQEWWQWAEKSLKSCQSTQEVSLRREILLLIVFSLKT